jgi:hypothetical protein
MTIGFKTFYDQNEKTTTYDLKCSYSVTRNPMKLTRVPGKD